MNIHDHLAHTLDQLQDTSPDPATLARTARARGAKIKRRRGLGRTAAATVLVLGFAGVTATVLQGPGNTSRVADQPGVPAPQIVDPDLSGPTTKSTPEGAALALHWAVAQQRTGTASDLGGQRMGPDAEQYAELRWDDADGLGASVVGLNVQSGIGRRGLTCPTGSSECTDTVAGDGSRLVTYEERSTQPDGQAIRRVVDLRRVDGTRVVISSTNGLEGEAGRWDLTRTEPPLDLADLEAIVRQPWWGPTLPEAFVDAGTDFTDYLDLGIGHDDWTRPAESATGASDPTSPTRTPDTVPPPEN